MAVEPDGMVKDGLVVGIDYSMALANGERIDTTEGEEPLEILQGAGEVIPGLESALYGMKVGDRKHVVVPPQEGFGEYQSEDNRLTVSRADFPDDFGWEPGMEVYVQTEEDAEPEAAYVINLNDQEVVLDFNHPLAGQTLHVDVTVRSLRPATEEELMHGHAHGEGWEEEEEEWEDIDLEDEWNGADGGEDDEE